MEGISHRACSNVIRFKKTATKIEASPAANAQADALLDAKGVDASESMAVINAYLRSPSPGFSDK